MNTVMVSIMDCLSGIVTKSSMLVYCYHEVVISRKCDWKDTYTYRVKVDGEPSGWSWSPQCFEEYDKEIEND